MRKTELPSIKVRSSLNDKSPYGQQSKTRVNSKNDQRDYLNSEILKLGYLTNKTLNA